MSRCLVLILIGMAAAGCGTDRLHLQSSGHNSGGVGMKPLPSIHESINGSELEKYPATLRTAAQDENDSPEVATADSSPRSRIRRAPWSPQAPRREGTGRPTPTTEETSDRPARSPQAGSSPMTATEPPDLLAEPPVPPPVVALGNDASLGFHPDAVPDVEPLAAGVTRSPEPAAPAVAAVPPLPVDPSLGPEPDAVPQLDLPMPTIARSVAAPLPATDPAPPPIPDSLPGTPAPANLPIDPSLGPTPDALPDLDMPPTPAPASAPAEPLPGLPDLPPAAPEPAAPVIESAPPVDPPSTAQRAPLNDDAVVRASTTGDTKSPLESRIAPGKAASETAARIGDEIITLNELRTAVREQIQSMKLPKDRGLSAPELNSIASAMLDRMIDRAILMQEARRKFKDEKRWKAFLDAVERVWKEKELPELIRQSSVRDELALREKMETQGLSLSDRHASFVQNTMSREFLMMQVRDKIRVFPAEMREYYDAHQSEFDRPAQVRWREVAIDVKKHKDRAEARRKAELALGRIRRGEPFDRVAMAEGEGPTAAQGGLWETAPDSYAVPAVNVALYRQPVQQVTGILEGPDSYHIVLIENRREAGPARFDEVQDEIRKILIERKEGQEMNAFLDDLRGRYIVTTMFDGTESAPSQTRRSR